MQRFAGVLSLTPRVNIVRCISESVCACVCVVSVIFKQHSIANVSPRAVYTLYVHENNNIETEREVDESALVVSFQYCNVCSLFYFCWVVYCWNTMHWQIRRCMLSS